MALTESQLESAFQTELIQELGRLFPGSLVLKNDANYIQGIPDLLVLWGPSWAALEVKASASARHRPNQDYYVEMLDEMSFACFICPDNKEEVLDALQHAFRSSRAARVSQRKQVPLDQLRQRQTHVDMGPSSRRRSRI